MAGMIGMAQTLAVYHYGYHTLKNQTSPSIMSLRENPRMQKLSSSGDLTRRLRRRINRHLQLPWL